LYGVTGRIGAAFDRLLVYGKGGVAFAHDINTLNDIAACMASTDLNRVGWTAGAGLEYAFNQNWTARIEYDYLGFGFETLNLPTPTFPAYSSSASLNVQEVKAGINFKFGPMKSGESKDRFFPFTIPYSPFANRS